MRVALRRPGIISNNCLLPLAFLFSFFLITRFQGLFLRRSNFFPLVCFAGLNSTATNADAMVIAILNAFVIVNPIVNVVVKAIVKPIVNAVVKVIVNPIVTLWDFGSVSIPSPQNSRAAAAACVAAAAAAAAATAAAAAATVAAAETAAAAAAGTAA